MACILIVEDNDRVRWTLAALLRSSGYDVAQATNGQQALTHFADHPADMVLMDVHMPIMDGLEACQRLRKASQVPILMISTFNSPTIQKQVLECGANGFIPKPLEFDLLMDWVRDASERGGGSIPLVVPPNDPPPGSGPAPRPPERPSRRSTRSRGPLSWQGSGPDQPGQYRPAAPSRCAP